MRLVSFIGENKHLRGSLVHRDLIILAENPKNVKCEENQATFECDNFIICTYDNVFGIEKNGTKVTVALPLAYTIHEAKINLERIIYSI